MGQVHMTPDQLSLLWYCCLRYYRGESRASRKTMLLFWDLKQAGLEVVR
jgi:hypothetical protein